jgi:VWFA-related protein
VLDPNTRAGVFTTSGRFTQVFTDDAAKLHDALNRIQPWTSINDKECLQISYYIADYLINWEHSLSPFGIVGLSSSSGPPGGSSSSSSGGSSATQSSTSLTQVSPLAEELLTEAAVCLNVQPPPPADPTAARYLWTTANNVLIYGQEETNSGLTVLKDLIAKMSALPGSRNIILVSPGFIMSAEHRNAENDILEKAIRASVVINSLDIRGVYTPLRSRSYDTEYGGNFGGPTNGGFGALLYQERERANKAEVDQASNVLAELAYGTGGTVHNDNDFEGGLKQLAARPEYVYVLGFSPDNLKNDGSYHALKVKLREPAKLDLEARRGYWAPNHAADPAEEAKEELKETLFSRDQIADIPLDVHAEFFKPGGAGSEVNKPQISVVARLDAKALRFRKAAQRNDDTLTVVTGLFDQNGNYISGIERVVELSLRDKSLEMLENLGISVQQSFSVTPGRYIVRVVVKDGEGRTTAARNTGIEVP